MWQAALNKRDKKNNKGVKKNKAQILLTAAKKCNSLFIICIVRLYRRTCCQLTEINLRFWQMQLFYLQCWKCYLQQKTFLHHFDLTHVNIIQLSVWLCQTAIMSIRLHLYSRHCHPQNKMPWSRGREGVICEQFCQGNIQSSFQQSLSTMQVVQPFPSQGSIAVGLWGRCLEKTLLKCVCVRFVLSSHLAGLFSSLWQMQYVSARLLFEIWISLMLEWWGHITHALK